MSTFSLPELSYPYDALEKEGFDEKTMEIHHTKHHQTYVDKLNEAMQKGGYADSDLRSLIANNYDDLAIRNHGGGHHNHSLWWKLLAPGRKDAAAQGDLLDALNDAFGSFENFQEQFTKKALSIFGSGWTWLVLSKDKELKILSTPNQDVPFVSSFGGEDEAIPLIGLDVWEHAYYLRYQNKRPEYVKAFWNCLNWDVVLTEYQKANS